MLGFVVILEKKNILDYHYSLLWPLHNIISSCSHTFGFETVRTHDFFTHRKISRYNNLVETLLFIN